MVIATIGPCNEEAISGQVSSQITWKCGVEVSVFGLGPKGQRLESFHFERIYLWPVKDFGLNLFILPTLNAFTLWFYRAQRA